MKFRYRGYNDESVAQIGTLEAETYSEAYAVLQYQGIRVITLSQEKISVLKLFSEYLTKWQLGERWTSTFFRELGVMLGVMTLHDALKLLSKATKDHVSQKILNELTQVIESGESLSAALRKHEIIFSDDIIQSVEVGEHSGRLQDIVGRLADQLERVYSTSRKVSGAMYYPIVVMVAAIVAAVVMVNVTLPVFESFYSEQGSTLPLITLVLLYGGRLLSAHWLTITIIFVLSMISVLVIYHKFDAVKFIFDGLKMRIKIFREIELRNLFGRLSFLLESGVTLDEAIKMCALSSGNLQIRKLLMRIQTLIEHGEKLGETFGKVLKNFSPLYLSLIVTGEESGNVVEMLRQCESMADFEIDEILRELPAKAEVFGTLAAGLIVGALVFAIVLPILNMTNLF